ncbi:MAG TPA: DUF3857 domain-containing protein [Chitinophagaceae bacterium]|nr:DUF3857 domain-containing protein [Chitinophagaceae bacterium]
MNRPSLLVAVLLGCTCMTVSAQTKAPVKFGKIAAEDFVIKQPYDTGAEAVVIADIGSTVIQGNAKGWFSLLYKRTTRIKILNKKGFDAAKVEIGLQTQGNAEEKLEDVRAYTYNLENGKPVETKLDAASIFKEQVNKNYREFKFTMPAVKEGSLIEYSYTIKSDFISNLRGWFFQSEYPCLWSEYEVGIPDFLNYVTIGQGFLTPEVNTGAYNANFRVILPGGADRDEVVNLDGVVNTRRWVVKNIPALKTEGYTTTVKNYIGAVNFQFSGYQFRGGIPHDFMGNWQLLGEKLMKREDFGVALFKNNNWLDDDLKTITNGAASKLDKARKIFVFVRDNVTCTDHTALLMETGIKDCYKKHSGNVAEINLLLAAMLRHEGITADPVLLSTREHGFTNELYPLLDRFNYVICRATIDNQEYDLDASSPYNGFAKLPTACFNGHGRLITSENALPVYYMADSLKEQKITSVFISNDEKAGLSGSFKSQLGYYESLELREKLKGEAAAHLKQIKNSFGFEADIINGGIDSLKQPDMPATVHYDFAFTPAAEGQVMYFNPMLSEGYKKNPFMSAERQYPVEMPYAMDETYLLNMEVPNGYTVEELPKSTRVAFNDDEGSFEYLVQQSGESIQLRCRVRLNKATFLPEDYSSLRDFFAFVVKKQNEQIVFKKK